MGYLNLSLPNLGSERTRDPIPSKSTKISRILKNLSKMYFVRAGTFSVGSQQRETIAAIEANNDTSPKANRKVPAATKTLHDNHLVL